MMKMNLNSSHIKRELVLQRTDVIPSPRDLVRKEQTDNL